MNPASYYNPQRDLHYKQVRQFVLPLNENQQLTFENITFSPEFISSPSSIMRMCCCSMSC